MKFDHIVHSLPLIAGIAASAWSFGIAPAAAADPAQPIDKTIPLICKPQDADGGGQLGLSLRVRATAPARVFAGGQLKFDQVVGEITLPRAAVNALQLLGSDRLAGAIPRFEIVSTGTSPGSLNVASAPIAFGPVNLTRNQPATFAVPGGAPLRDLPPLAVTGAVGRAVQARLGAVVADLTFLSSTDPEVSAAATLVCTAAEGADTLLASIPIDAAPPSAAAVLRPAGPLTAPSNAFTLQAPKRSGTSVQMSLSNTDPGLITQVGTRRARSGGPAVSVCSAWIVARRGGSFPLTCRLDAATRAAQRKGRVRLVLRTTFEPVGGPARTVTTTVVLPRLRR